MRRKHKRMELVRLADRHKYRPDEHPTGEQLMSRRTFIFKGLVLGGFAALAGKLWKMQVIDAKSFQTQATDNINQWETLKAPRGLIVDRNNKVLADNRISWTVSVVPAQLPDDQSQVDQIRDTLVQKLKLQPMLVVRKSALPLGSENYVLTELAPLVNQKPADLIAFVLHTQHDSDLVTIENKLDKADATRLSSAVTQLPGVHVMDPVTYAIESSPGSPLKQTVMNDVPRDVALMLASNQLYLPGVQIDDSKLVREYLGGPDFSHILGYVGAIDEKTYDSAVTSTGTHIYQPDDDIGEGGLEQAMESQLRGKKGIRYYRTNAQGVEIAELPNLSHDAVPGNTVVTTIDSDFQRAVAEALQNGIDAANAGVVAEGLGNVGAGVVVAIDPRNGEIRAMVSLPTFDNQLFVNGISEKQFEAYLNDPYKPLTDFSISGAFPPGSTIKPLLASAALQDGTLTENTTFVCTGAIRVPTAEDEAGGNTYRCWDKYGHGPIAVEYAIGGSCDVFFYNVSAPGQKIEGTNEILHYYNQGDPNPHNFTGMGIDVAHQYLTEQFGWGTPTGIELAGEVGGLVPDPKWLFQSLRAYWAVGDTINVSIGQGYLTCTPLQLAASHAAIANSGTFYTPRLVKELRDAHGQLVKSFPPVGRKLNIKPEYLDMVRRGLRLTVSDPSGTAYGKFHLTGNDFPIAGKTGTAEYGDYVKGAYHYTRSHAWFTAFAPFDEPEIAVAVLIEGGGEGATYAVPVADAVLAAYFKRPPPAGNPMPSTTPTPTSTPSTA